MADEHDRSSWHPALMPSGHPDLPAHKVSGTAALASSAVELPEPATHFEPQAPEPKDLPEPTDIQENANAFSASANDAELEAHDIDQVRSVEEEQREEEEETTAAAGAAQSTIAENGLEPVEAQPVEALELVEELGPVEESQPVEEAQPLENRQPLEEAQSLEAQPLEARLEAQVEAQFEAPASSPPPIHKPQHSSSQSFARTVSHEVSFNDDDDTEWSFSRTDTDPFKSMPQPEKTNSFPLVPPMVDLNPDHHWDAPLQSNQAMDMVEEAEKDLLVEEQQYQGDTWAMDFQKPGHRRVPSHSIGGDVQQSEAAADEARFEEGVPLIPHLGNGFDREFESTPSGVEGSFDNGGDENDGFFSQIQDAEVDAAIDENDMPHIRRKSTMQVLEATNSSHVATEEPLEETLEETLEEAQGKTLVETPMQEKEDQMDTRGERNDHDTIDSINQSASPKEEDLASKWQEAFADEQEDIDFLQDDSTTNRDLDAAAFLGSDDEGLLEDEEPVPEPVPASSLQTAAPSHPQVARTASSYMPAHQQASTYPPMTTTHTVQNPYAAFGQIPPAPPAGLASHFGQPPPPQIAETKAESFADKPRGGYSSPYDLPTDLITTNIKIRKRPSTQHPPHDTSSHPLPPPRSASLNVNAPPLSSVASVHHKPTPPPARTHESFFEDLPITAKTRPSSRQSHGAPSQSTYAPPRPPSLVSQTGYQPPHAPASIPPGTSIPPGVSHLVGPERMGPYATTQASAPPVPPPSGSASRYSPAPAHPLVQPSSALPAVANRYSPAPPAPRPPSSYNSAPMAIQQSVHHHLPRTSSPLAHFEMTNEKAHALGYASAEEAAQAGSGPSSPYESRITRVPSLPPTREVAEEEEGEDDDDLVPVPNKESLPQSPPPPAAATIKYSPSAAAAARRTPPPPSLAQSMASRSHPPQRPGSSALPHAPASAQGGFVPPPRASTQSPGATRAGKHAAKTSDPGRLTASQNSPTAPVVTQSSTHAPARPLPSTMDMIAPTDGREHDPLHRWQGVPIISWGVGGTIVTSFPKSVPRYVMNQTAPLMLRNAGEVRVRNIKDIEPLHQRLSKFPGPLKGKSKKKEVLAWLSAGIDSLEQETAAVPLHAQDTIQAKRADERLLLWKILRVFIQFDGVLEGSPAIDKAVRAILFPSTLDEGQGDAVPFPTAATVPGLPSATMTSMQSDGVDAGAMDQIRRDLLRGEHETAIWAAVDKRLWGHAMLISHTVSPDLYKRVAQEFVRKEVNHSGHSNESLAALYKVLSGNYDDCVDELVPVHARAGLQLVSTGPSSGSTAGAIDGLDKWRETLTLVLSNRSADDVRGLNALGKLLAGYGRAEAAHVCFIFSRSISVFGGMDDPSVDYVLVGSDHRQSSLQLAQDTEALQLSEVFEYGLSLSGAPSFAAGAPHLAAYKLHHAMTLAEYGQRDKALQYCDAIITAISAQTRRSPYHHSILETAVGDLTARLKQAPKEESSSWMSKPTMNKVSDSMWNRFNKFVAGDEQDGNSALNEGDSGPFARITTPTLSRSPSVTNFESFGVMSPGYSSPPLSVPASTSRYAPQAAQSSDPMSTSMPLTHAFTSRRSNEYTPSSYEPSYPGAGSPNMTSGSAFSSGASTSQYGFQSLDAGVRAGTGSEAHSTQGRYQPLDSNVKAGHEASGVPMPSYQPTQPLSYGYEPPQMNTISDDAETNEKSNGAASGGFEPPSMQPYGYEPPSYEPGPEPAANDDDDDDDEASKPKKKSFMDDDDDDISAPTSQNKSRAERDRENDELFRKAAEEDAKRAAAQQSGKKGWGFSGWFGGGSKKEASTSGDSTPGKPIKAKLGEASSFVYDPELKRWINKKAGAENTPAKTATPPPPKAAGVRSVSGTPPIRAFTPPPAAGRASVPPSSSQAGGLLSPPQLNRAASQGQLGAAPAMLRSASGASTNIGPPSRPPSRPNTVSNASSIDDLLSTSGPRKPGQKKTRKAGRYVDVMAK